MFSSTRTSRWSAPTSCRSRPRTRTRDVHDGLGKASANPTDAESGRSQGAGLRRPTPRASFLPRPQKAPSSLPCVPSASFPGGVRPGARAALPACGPVRRARPVGGCVAVWCRGVCCPLPSRRRRFESGRPVRTRDPHLGKVFEFVCDVHTNPLSCSSVHRRSRRIRPEFNPVVERSTSDRVPRGDPRAVPLPMRHAL